MTTEIPYASIPPLRRWSKFAIVASASSVVNPLLLVGIVFLTRDRDMPGAVDALKEPLYLCLVLSPLFMNLVAMIRFGINKTILGSGVVALAFVSSILWLVVCFFWMLTTIRTC